MFHRPFIFSMRINESTNQRTLPVLPKSVCIAIRLFVYSSIRLFVYSRFSPLVAFQVQPIEFYLCEFQIESLDIGLALIGMKYADE